MDFSELFKFSGLAATSPDGKLLASALNYKLVIRNVQSLQIVQLYTCIDAITHIEWSSDSKYILCVMSKRAAMQVWSVEDENWNCKIEEGPAGVTTARFSPDGRHILSVADFQLRITIWSLLNQSTQFIKYPKFSNKGIDFTPDGRYMAVVERRDCKDFVGVYTTETWELVKHFQVDTHDLADIKWSPDGRVLCVWDSLLQYRVLFYAPDGRKLESYSAYEHALGIKNVTWAPSSRLLAVGSYDTLTRILSAVTYRVIAEFEHLPEIRNPKAVVFQEIPFGSDDANHPSTTTRTRYIVRNDTTIAIHTVKVPPEQPNPKIGVGLLKWSSDSRFLATRNDNMPETLWIWDMSRLSLSTVILQMDPITSAEWDPVHPRLAICTGSERVYIWTAEGCSCIDVPAVNFKVHSLRWNQDGQALLMRDKALFCVCYPVWNPSV